MKKSITRIIEKYDLKEDLENLFSIENENNDPDLPPEYKRKENFVYNSLKYIPKIMKIIKKKTGIELGNPMVCPSEENSIDFYWKAEDYDLLANVSENSGASYYMIGPENEKIAEGTLN